MAKFRQNHSKSDKKPFARMALRVFVLLGIFGMLFVWFYNIIDETRLFDSDDQVQTKSDSDNDRESDYELSSFIPENNRSDVIFHEYYVMGYNEAHEQPDWVAYELTYADLKIPNVPRAKRFTVDNNVGTKSAKHSDYTRSGYTRGHMVPAGDMAFSKLAMQETFFMSNMSPQLAGFNGGIWRELEESVRDWAYKYDELFVASGPIFNDVTEYIGQTSKVRVPSGFFKIIVDYKGNHPKGIGFILPHVVIDQSLKAYATSIDDLERRVGIDFFDELYEDNMNEEEIEAQYDMSKWPLSKRRFQNRVQNWNNN